MKFCRRFVLWISVAAGLCFGQGPAFEAASVKVLDPAAQSSFGTTGGPGTSDPGRIHYGRVTMIELLMKAYGVQSDQVAGPAWIRDFMGPNRYDITAMLPPDTTKEQLKVMLQNLLAERFHLVVHHETRGFPGYELVVAKGGPKMKEVTPTPPPKAAESTAAPVRPSFERDADGFPKMNPGPGVTSFFSAGKAGEKYQEQSMEVFAKSLGSNIRMAMGGDSGSPLPRVTDKTGLTGRYDFKLEYACLGCRGLSEIAASLPQLAARAGAPATPETASDPLGSGLPTIFSAIEKQLGLKLEKVKDVPVDVIVVDRVEKVPVEN